jgi:hypothetical protein
VLVSRVSVDYVAPSFPIPLFSPKISCRPELVRIKHRPTMTDAEIVNASVPLSVATVLSSLCCEAHDLAVAASERHALLLTTR